MLKPIFLFPFVELQHPFIISFYRRAFVLLSHDLASFRSLVDTIEVPGWTSSFVYRLLLFLPSLKALHDTISHPRCPFQV